MLGNGKCYRTDTVVHIESDGISSGTPTQDDLLVTEDSCTCCLEKLSNSFEKLWSKNRKLVKLSVLFVLFVLYNVYWAFAISISWSSTEEWCDGVKFLTIINICIYCGLFYFLVLKRTLSKIPKRSLFIYIDEIVSKLFRRKFSGIIMFFIVLASIFVFILTDTQKTTSRYRSFGGIIALLTFGFIFSKHPRKVQIRQITWGIGLQFVFALVIIRWPTGKLIFDCIASKISHFFSYTDYGSNLVFGYLANGKLSYGNASMDSLITENHSIGNNLTAINLELPAQMGVFAFKILPVICFFSFCISILYYYGVMQWVVIKVGWVLKTTIGTTAAESMNAAANIFMGQTEAPLLIRPYLAVMTKSEIHAVMTGGFATIAGAVMAAYISIGINASHLLSASVMSAPAALAYSKLFYPETEESKTKATSIKIEKGKERNALEAATTGVILAITLIANIAANLLAFTAFIYFVDALISWFGSLVGWTFLSLTYLMSKIFMPLAYLMGVPWSECELVGQLIGLKTIINEFVAYDKLHQIKHLLSARSEAIATYALCGFSNLASVGIQIGGLGAMAPNRIQDFAQVAIRAVIAGSAACFLTACIAGSLISENDLYSDK